MNDVKQLSNDTIQLQHEIRLTSKKIDVVGVIQSKVRDNIESLRDEVVNYHSDVLKIDTESISEGREQLFEKYKALEAQYAMVVAQLGQLLNETDNINLSLSASRQSALDELNRQQVVTTVQMDNLAESVADASMKLDDHIKHVELSDIESGVVHVGGQMETFLTNIQTSHKQMDDELANMNESMDKLSNQQKTIDELNSLFHGTVKTLRETLKSIDDKVCQISPLYTGPSAKDIEDSFNKMASVDISHLMHELHDKYQQTTKEVNKDDDISHFMYELNDDYQQQTEEVKDDDKQVNEHLNESDDDTEVLDEDTSDIVEEVSEPTQIIVTLPEDLQHTSSTSVSDSNVENKHSKKGFFNRLFGGDN